MIRAHLLAALSLALALVVPAVQDPEPPSEPYLPRLEAAHEEQRYLDHEGRLLPPDFDPAGSQQTIVFRRPAREGEVCPVRVPRPAGVVWVDVPPLLDVAHAEALQRAAERGLRVRYFLNALPPDDEPYEPGPSEHLVWVAQAPPAGYPVARGSDVHVSVRVVPIEPVSPASPAVPIGAGFHPDPAGLDLSQPWVRVPDLVGLEATRADLAVAEQGLTLVPGGAGALPAQPSQAAELRTEVALQVPPADSFLPRGADVEVVLVSLKDPASIPYVLPGHHRRWLGEGPTLMPPDFEPDEEASVVAGMPAGPDEYTLVWMPDGLAAEDVSWVTVPDLVGQLSSAAETACTILGLDLACFTNVSPPMTTTPSTGTAVDRQSPAAGTVVAVGSTVNVVVSLVSRAP